MGIKGRGVRKSEGGLSGDGFKIDFGDIPTEFDQLDVGVRVRGVREISWFLWNAQRCHVWRLDNREQREQRGFLRGKKSSMSATLSLRCQLTGVDTKFLKLDS